MIIIMNAWIELGHERRGLSQSFFHHVDAVKTTK
jgi:hypothetical protein